MESPTWSASRSARSARPPSSSSSATSTTSRSTAVDEASVGGSSSRLTRAPLAIDPQSDRPARSPSSFKQHLQLGGRPFGDRFAGVFRVDDRRRTMNLHAGTSDDGIVWRIEEEPIKFCPRTTGCRRSRSRSRTPTDPRVTPLDGRFYVTWCNGYHGPTIGVAWTEDFERFPSSTTRSCRSTATASSFRDGSATATRC